MDTQPLRDAPEPATERTIATLQLALATLASLLVWQRGGAAGAARDDDPESRALAPPARPPIPSRDEFTAAFAALGGSVRALARHFARDRRQIYRWLEAHGLRGRRDRIRDGIDPRSLSGTS